MPTAASAYRYIVGYRYIYVQEDEYTLYISGCGGSPRSSIAILSTRHSETPISPLNGSRSGAIIRGEMYEIGRR